MSGNAISVGGSSKYAKAFTVPPEFPETLRTLVREILRNQPQSAHEIHKFGKNYFFFIFLFLMFILFYLFSL